MSGDIIDPGLVTELHAQLEAANNALAKCQRGAEVALRLAEAHGKELADLRASLAVEPTDLEHEARSSAFWFASWREMRRLRAEDRLCTAALVRCADRAVTIADEAFGLGPAEPLEETLSRIERGIFGQRQRISELEREVAALRCGDLSKFMDEQLDEARAQAFRDHLATCERCSAGLHDLMSVEAIMSDGGH